MKKLTNFITYRNEICPPTGTFFQQLSAETPDTRTTNEHGFVRSATELSRLQPQKMEQPAGGSDVSTIIRNF